MQAKMEVIKAPLFDLIGKSIRKGLIENGMDLPIQQALDDLKLKFRSIANEGLGTGIKTSTLGSSQEKEITISKSDEEIVKFLNGADLSQYNRSKTYTELIQSKIAVINNYTNIEAKNTYSHTRFRLQISDHDTFAGQYELAKQHFNNCTFVSKNSDGTLKVLLNPGLDLTPYIKLVCTTDTGDTTKARDKFKGYKENKRQSGQHYAEWTLTDQGTKFVERSFINETPIIQAIKNSDFIAVDNLVNDIKNKTIQSQIKEKIDKLQISKDLPPGIQHINNINKLITNLEIKKEIEETKVKYTLVTNIESDLDSSGTGTKEDFLDKIKEEIKLWQVSHEKVWFEKFVKVAIEILNKIVNRYTL